MRERLLSTIDAGLAEVGRAAEPFGDSALLAAARPLREAGQAYREALGALAAEREKLIRIRDARLLAQFADYDSIFEMVSTSIGFDLSGEAAEDLRQRVMTVHMAVNEVRIGSQRLLATGDETQARRVRRGAAQTRVHGRGLGAVEVPARLRDDLSRLSELAVAIGAASEELLASLDEVAKIRAERVQPARTALSAALSAMADVTQAATGQRRQELAERVADVRLGTLWTGMAIAFVLVLSGLLMARAIGAPLRRLAAAMGRISAGEAAVEVPDRGRRDEIGAIAGALETLRGTVGRAFAQGQMLEQLPTAVMSADPKDEFRITYMNTETMRLLGRIRDALPVPAEQMVGQSIDIFHRDPSHQQRLLSDPSRLPHSTKIRLGEEGDRAARLGHPRRHGRLCRRHAVLGPS
jgi:methyl-accepting chemotaxis protein